MPRRSDIDPVKLGDVSTLDVVPGEPVDFRYRFLGQRLALSCGFDLT